MKNLLGQFVRLRYVILIVLLVILTNTLLALYNLRQFEAITTLELKHEGLLLSHALEAGIASYAEVGNIQSIQEKIDRFVAARDNDIEVNVILLEGEKSSIVASNIAQNIEETSADEHEDLLASLKHGKPVVYMGEDEDLDEDDEQVLGTDANGTERFDFHAEKFLNIMVPLIANGKGLGSINARLSLMPLEKRKKAIGISLLIAIIIEIFLVLAGLAIVTRLLIEERTKLLEEEAVRLQAELKALQAQVNPHFLFNALNSISSLILDNPRQAENLVEDIADLFRNILGASEQGWWTVNDELALVRNYLNIESIRLKEKLSFKINISSGAENLVIPCLLIQPLVENAIKHGINRCVSGGKIEIEIIAANELSIKVKDILNINGNYPLPGIPSGQKSGIENMLKRLDIIYGKNATLTLKRSAHGAVCNILIKDIRKFKHAKIQSNPGR